jgi:hypothetical protein
MPLTCVFEITRTPVNSRCVAHNPEVAVSNPVPATKSKRPSEIAPGAAFILDGHVFGHIRSAKDLCRLPGKIAHCRVCG